MGLSAQIPSVNPGSSGLHGDDPFCLVDELLADSHGGTQWQLNLRSVLFQSRQASHFVSPPG